MDAAGNLFGTTEYGGPDAQFGSGGEGTVFEIAKTANGYASTPTFLVKFQGTNGGNPTGKLVMDPPGNLFGTTGTGGVNNTGTVSQIPRPPPAYSTILTPLAPN